MSKNKKTVTPLSKQDRLEMAIISLATKLGESIKFNITIYKEAQLVEQIYLDLCVSDKDFFKKYPKFMDFMEKRVPLFELKEYLKYKPLIVLDNENLLSRLDNGALRFITKKTVNLTKFTVNENAIIILKDLPADKTITENDIKNSIFRNQNLFSKSSSSQSKVTTKAIHNKASIMKFTKVEIADMYLKLQKKHIDYKKKMTNKI